MPSRVVVSPLAADDVYLVVSFSSYFVAVSQRGGWAGGVTRVGGKPPFFSGLDSNGDLLDVNGGCGDLGNGHGSHGGPVDSHGMHHHHHTPNISASVAASLR